MYQTKINNEKEQAVKELKEFFSSGSGYVLADYRGITVAQITTLRNELKNKNAKFKIVKNRYAKIALKELNVNGFDDFLTGPTAVAVTNDELGPVAKSVFSACDESPMTVKAGFLSGEIMDAKAIEAYSKLPTRLELIQMLMGTIQAPVSKLLRTIKAVGDAKN